MTGEDANAERGDEHHAGENEDQEARHEDLDAGEEAGMEDVEHTHPHTTETFDETGVHGRGKRRAAGDDGDEAGADADDTGPDDGDEDTDGNAEESAAG